MLLLNMQCSQSVLNIETDQLCTQMGQIAFCLLTKRVHCLDFWESDALITPAFGCCLCGWCNLHNAGCIIKVAGHVLWPRAAWLYQEAVTHKEADISVSGGLQIVGM